MYLRKLLTVDEMRAGIEEPDKAAYDKWGHYENLLETPRILHTPFRGARPRTYK